LYETITSSQAGTVSNLFVELGKRIVEEDYDDPTFSVDLLVKDISLAVGMARKSDSISLLGQTITWMNELARIQGYGRKDTAVMWKCLLNIWDKKKDL
jgi:3-hydroxyisobutyrate dehydrogenase-like beta-hydroxyacid dehydrogenase